MSTIQKPLLGLFIATPLWCWRVLFVAWLGFIVWASLTTSGASLPSFPHIDKLAHAMAYAVCASLFLQARIRTKVLYAVLFSASLGVAMEFTQLYFPPRTMDVWDALANALGAVIGAFCFWLFQGWIQNKLDSNVAP